MRGRSQHSTQTHGRPDPTFDRARIPRRPTSTIDTAPREREVNTQKWASGTKPQGGDRGPGMDF